MFILAVKATACDLFRLCGRTLSGVAPKQYLLQSTSRRRPQQGATMGVKEENGSGNTLLACFSTTVILSPFPQTFSEKDYAILVWILKREMGSKLVALVRFDNYRICKAIG